MAHLSKSSNGDDPPLQEELLQSRYEDWKQRFHDQTSPKLAKEYMFSTSWEDLWQGAWAEYDQLESNRIQGGFARQTWQDSMEEDRRRCEELRKYKSKSASLTTHEWSLVPLGMILEKYLGISIGSGGKNEAIALERWWAFCDIATQGPQFLASLSFIQRVSWTLLTHWWLGAYQESSLSNAAIASLEAAAFSPFPMIHKIGELYPDAETFKQLRKSVYNAIMFDLFFREFNPYFWEPHLRVNQLAVLRSLRFEAIRHATAQRLGYTSYMYLRGLKTSDCGPYIGSYDKPCPWLPREGKSKELPFYLWDVEQKRTVIVNELSTNPEEYCCVSHTWGRWRKDAITIEGVPWPVPQNEKFDVERLPEHLQQIQPRIRFIWIDLFCIPQDGSPKADDEINRQALIFQNASRCIAWINDAKQWGGTVKALDWLGVSYLHATTVPGIYDTGKLLSSLHHEANTVSELFLVLDDPSEVMNAYSAGLTVASGPRSISCGQIETFVEPAHWFSSLWTLQEAMLCPDITFVSRDWIPLNDRAGTPVPLDAFCGFISTVDSVWRNGMPYRIFTEGTIRMYSRYSLLLKSDEHFHPEDHQRLRWPNGPRQLEDLCVVTKMENLFKSSSPIGLLMLPTFANVPAAEHQP